MKALVCTAPRTWSIATNRRPVPRTVRTLLSGLKPAVTSAPTFADRPVGRLIIGPRQINPGLTIISQKIAMTPRNAGQPRMNQRRIWRW